MAKRLAIASHVALIDGKPYDGIGNAIIEAMSAAGQTYYMVRHSMEGLLPSEVHEYSPGKQKKVIKKLGVVRNPGPLRYITELISTVAYFTFRKKVDVYVGIDPLNACAAVFLKKLGRIDHCVFFTPDYSPRRFDNERLNKIYHAIDRYCVRHADEVWCVSTRIQEVRRNMGLPEEKNILVPNVPPAKFSDLRKGKRAKHTLTTNGIIGKQLDFEGAIRAVATLKDEFPEIAFDIVGNGPEEARLKELCKELKVADRVQFLGRKPLKGSLEVIASSGVGLALYTGEWGFNHYGDSTKCREFFFFGLPVISTDSHSTVPEIKQYKAGEIVETNVDQYVKAIRKIFKSYDAYTASASELGDKYNDVHKRELLRITQE